MDVVEFFLDVSTGATRKISKCPWCGDEFLSAAIYGTGTNNFAIAFHEKCEGCRKLENDAKLAEYGLKRLAKDDPSV